jgi:hypothetical protein
MTLWIAAPKERDGRSNTEVISTFFRADIMSRQD